MIKNQFDIIYNNIDLEFRRDIKKLDENVIINQFLTNVDECKHK